MHQYGFVIATGDNYIIREKLTADGKLLLFVHRRNGDKELLPRGYVGGSNMLEFELTKKEPTQCQ